MGFSPRAGARPGWAPAPSLADGNPFPGHLLPSLGARWFRSSSGPSPAGHGCFGGCPGAAPWGAGEAVSTLGRLSHCPGSPGGASPPGGLRRGASGGACGLAQSRGGRSLWAQGQASLARPQLWRGARGVNPGLGGSSRHRDGGGVMGAAGRAHIGRPIHGQQGRPHGLPSRGEVGFHEAAWGSVTVSGTAQGKFCCVPSQAGLQRAGQLLLTPSGMLACNPTAMWGSPGLVGRHVGGPS